MIRQKVDPASGKLKPIEHTTQWYDNLGTLVAEIQENGTFSSVGFYESTTDFGDGSSVGFVHDTVESITVNGDKHTSWRHNGNEFAWMSPTVFGVGSFGVNNVTNGWSFGFGNTQNSAYGFCQGFQNVNTGGGSPVFGLSNQNLGAVYSPVMGLSNVVQASAFFSVTLGVSNAVSGGGSVTLGGNNTNSGGGGIAIGGNNTVTGTNSVSMGATNNNTGANSYVMGTQNTISGSNSSALGSVNKIKAQVTFALGANLKSPSGTGKTMLGASLPANSAVNSIADSFSACIRKSFNSIFFEKNKRAYLETPNLAIMDEASWDGIELVGTTTYSKTTDGTTPFTQAITGMEIGANYLFTFNVTSTTVADEGFTPSLTGMGITFNLRDEQTGLKTELFTATSTSDTLSFAPSNLSRFDITSISIQKLTGGDLSVSGNAYLKGGINLPTRETAVATTITATDHTIRFINTVDITQTLPTTLPVGKILALKNKSNYTVGLVGIVDDQTDPAIPASVFPQPTMRIQYNELGTWDII